eukprot:CAMPEP_0204368888 /NCGR_PEP_ID=MMETSP0469-20131031/44544_1 /ASSEMBLY_ACC=CAM_ASM_000384 /TAXON_ID=2969 /ORGANISM="Oxyrrhis marina" /LENGTH=192 /DNA_ID=CAMNT_0051358519 /DNA_START=15 /DNA_END=593 /DNA_ORIENTATION=-
MSRWTCLVALASAVEFSVHVNAGGTKCFGEELAKHELLVAEFSTATIPITVEIQDPQTVIFTEHEKTQVKTAFTTNQAGPHVMCIVNSDKRQKALVKVNVAFGPQAKDYSQIAKKEHLEPTQIALRRIEENLKNYHSNVLYMREREERMRSTNDSIAFRVIGYCLFNVVLMIAVGGWQMFHFKQFFRSKKVI